MFLILPKYSRVEEKLKKNIVVAGVNIIIIIIIISIIINDDVANLSVI